MRAFIIIINGRTLSETLGNECIRAAENQNVEISKFDAIDGNAADEHFRNLRLKCCDDVHSGPAIKHTPGVRGCFLSHYYLWRKCLEIAEPIIILEHDGYFINPIPSDLDKRFIDICNLNHTNFNKLVIDDTKSYDAEMSLAGPVEVIQPTNLNSKRSAGRWLPYAYGYAIQPAGAQKLIGWAHKFGALPADVIIGDKVVDIVCTKPSLVRLHHFFDSAQAHKTHSYTNRLNQIS